MANETPRYEPGCGFHFQVKEVLAPLLDYLDEVEKSTKPHELIMILIPEFITHKWWQYFLHNQSGLILKSVLFFNKSYVIASVPYHLSEPQKKERNNVIKAQKRPAFKAGLFCALSINWYSYL